MTNTEAYLSDLKDLETAITAIKQLVPEGTTKSGRQNSAAAARLSEDALATISCMKNDYIPVDEYPEDPRSEVEGKVLSEFAYGVTLLSQASFPARLEADGALCIVEVMVYRLNATAVTSFMLDGSETILQHLGLSEADTYITRHEVDDIVTIVHVNREGAAA